MIVNYTKYCKLYEINSSDIIRISNIIEKQNELLLEIKKPIFIKRQEEIPDWKLVSDLVIERLNKVFPNIKFQKELSFHHSIYIYSEIYNKKTNSNNKSKSLMRISSHNLPNYWKFKEESNLTNLRYFNFWNIDENKFNEIQQKYQDYLSNLQMYQNNKTLLNRKENIQKYTSLITQLEYEPQLTHYLIDEGELDKNISVIKKYFNI